MIYTDRKFVLAKASSSGSVAKHWGPDQSLTSIGSEGIFYVFQHLTMAASQEVCMDMSVTTYCYITPGQFIILLIEKG